MTKVKSPHLPKIDRRMLLKGIGATAIAGATTRVAAIDAQEEQKTPRAMRSPKPKSQRNVGKPTTPPLEVIALNRMAFGPRPGDLEAFRALGSSDDARLQAYVDQQLDPNLDDSAFEASLIADDFPTLTKSLTQQWVDHRLNYNSRPPGFTNSSSIWRYMPMHDTQRATFNRALHSRRQLQEVLADFWHNHFNVFGWSNDAASIFVHYDRDVIRANMLGNFRTMLEAVGKSTAMLYYLDNRTNSGGNPNENYARELFEIHAMGAENYAGTTPQDQIPVDESGTPIAYGDDDVYGATTCFTGWQVDTDTGEFFYNSEDHFKFQKVVFGQVIPANQGELKDGRDVYDMLASHPGTGRYIARKLCIRLIGDNPPDDVVAAAAAIFNANVNASDQLSKVVRTILLSDAFKTTWGDKIKRPFEAVMSGLRAVGTDFRLPRYPWSGSDPMRTFLSLYSGIGQPLFAWRPPNGYPDSKEDWTGTVSILQRWRLFNWMLDWQTGGTLNLYQIDVLGLTPTGNTSSNALVDFWIGRILGRAMDSQDRQEIVDFMAQGRNPDLELPLETDEDTQDRLRMMVSLILNAPEFQWR